MWKIVVVYLSIGVLCTINAQPMSTPEGIRFTLKAPDASQVHLAGEFNGWSEDANPMVRKDGGLWIVVINLSPGIYQYKFVIDGGRVWREDPENPVKVDDNFGGYNSVLTITQDYEVLLKGYEEERKVVVSDEYPKTGGTIYLNIIWHQHQPMYLDPAKDQLQGPWVRAHATKDYYDMAAILQNHPEVHVTIDLTSSLLYQLQKYYVERLASFVDVKSNRVDTKGYFSKYGGKTDPWIDILLKNTKDLNEDDLAWLYKNPWNFFGINEIMINRFPAYLALREKPRDEYSEQDLREIKFWHFLAWMDPDFLKDKVELPLGYSVDLSDLVEETEADIFELKRKITEEDCARLLAEVYKVMANVIPIHKKLIYNCDKLSGQIEVITTPFYHPILPLVYDTEIARVCQPKDPLPPRFSYPQDAISQVEKAVQFYRKTFGLSPTGMWPAEGSVSEDIIPVFRASGIQWIATADKVLYRSKPAGLKLYYPYVASEKRDELVIVFRDTPISDKIGFRYQNYYGEEAADDFIRSVLHYAPPEGEPARLLSVILDGENAWEWYKKDIDGKGFLNALYRKLEKLYETRQIVTVTPTEYIRGNPKRGVPPHLPESLAKLEYLWPGSWIAPDYRTWIGEPEENLAWEYLLKTRGALENSGIRPPSPLDEAPKQGTKEWYRWMAWEEIYAAEGSDWFWWYGGDQGAPGGDEPFDKAFITHLENVYEFARKYGAKIGRPDFKPIIASLREKVEKGRKVLVIFECDPGGRNVPDAIYVVGDKPELGNWTPNKIRMYDDGTHGDAVAGDGIWSIGLDFAEGTYIEYKYTNSGTVGVWTPSEEFPVTNRTLSVSDPDKDGKLVIKDTFGVLE